MQLGYLYNHEDSQGLSYFNFLFSFFSMLLMYNISQWKGVMVHYVILYYLLLGCEPAILYTC